MSLAVVYSRANIGIDARLVEVEVHLTNSRPKISIVGLPETTVKESIDRVCSALISCNFYLPIQRITINLAPADLPKEGGRYDLAIALGILVASKQLPSTCLYGIEVGGELALSGELRGFEGCLPMVVAAKKAGHSLILPKVNANGCAFVTGVKIFAASSLLEVCNHLYGRNALTVVREATRTVHPDAGLDLREVYGQQQAKRALEIVAAGGHSVLMIGTPGSGKTMLANRLPGILPPLSEEQKVEVALIQSLIRNSNGGMYKVSQRPFRAPHHSLSNVALVGGGRIPKPGEVSLSHHGVLFLDELPEFNRAALEALREPLESGEVLVSRAAYTVKYPAQFQLVAAMNPCPCGYLGDESSRCRCTREQVDRYQAKISGPLLDRIDLQLWVKALPVTELLRKENTYTESSEVVRQRVYAAQQIQQGRARQLNHFLSTHEINRLCVVDQADKKYLEQAILQLNLSARAYHRILKVARTVADLAQSVRINREHLQEVLSLRGALLR